MVIVGLAGVSINIVLSRSAERIALSSSAVRPAGTGMPMKVSVHIPHPIWVRRDDLRIAVNGGGCQGFEYSFGLETAKAADDVVFERDTGLTREAGL